MHEDGLEVHGDQDNAKMLVTRRKGFEQEQKRVNGRQKTGKKVGGYDARVTFKK